MILTAILSLIVALAYIGLGTVRFVVATEAVLAYARKLSIPHIIPEWFPDWMRTWFATIFRWSARLFFLGCAYTHFEIAAHGFAGDLPVDYANIIHQLSMLIQGIGAWVFVAVLSLIDSTLKEV